jgi:small subunit ribosomal protein S6
LAAHVYEAMFILDSNRYARDPSGVASELNSMIEQCGGAVMVSRLWNEQKLAYPIDGHKKGTYWLSYFRMESTRQPELTRKCRLNESILRKLVIKIDPRIADPLVQHAAGGAVSMAAAASSTTSAES